MLVDQWKGYLVFVLPLKPVSQEEISEIHGEHNKGDSSLIIASSQT